ncbi:unnamed protein product [Ilex paraguariensis]|uniref:Pectin acetylesterase n=1 Tax=Ilex paraguariensis TaxID=185542 RepID=A0ABC8UU14_9AQUA
MANHGLRGFILWRRRWAKREWIIAAAVGFAILIFAFSLLSNSSSKQSKPNQPFDSSINEGVPFTSLRNAKDRGAYCLDGSIPGYHFQKGFGSGSDNWVLHIEGGGWCNTIELCSLRKRTAVGSSNYMDHEVQFSGILSRDPSQNPDFFNWNKVKIRYCDGASFAGHPESEFRGVAKSLDENCIAGVEPSMCFFPQEFIKHIKTPIFLVQPAYDFWQVTFPSIRNILVPDASDPHGSWFKCKLNIHNCNPSQIEVLQGFRSKLLKTLSEFQQNKEGGMFVNSCFVHCQTWMAETWHSPSSPRINSKVSFVNYPVACSSDKSIAESVGDWYFNRKAAKQIDCPYPCNPTCYHVNLT